MSSVCRAPLIAKTPGPLQCKWSGWDRLARSYFENNDYRRALNALHHLTSLGESTAAWNNMAVIYEKLSEPETAASHYAKALMTTHDRASIVAAKNFTLFLESIKRSEEASRIADTYLKGATPDSLKKNQDLLELLFTRIRIGSNSRLKMQDHY